MPKDRFKSRNSRDLVAKRGSDTDHGGVVDFDHAVAAAERRRECQAYLRNCSGQLPRGVRASVEVVLDEWCALVVRFPELDGPVEFDLLHNQFLHVLDLVRHVAVALQLDKTAPVEAREAMFPCFFCPCAIRADNLQTHLNNEHFARSRTSGGELIPVYRRLVTAKGLPFVPAEVRQRIRAQCTTTDGGASTREYKEAIRAWQRRELKEKKQLYARERRRLFRQKKRRRKAAEEGKPHTAPPGRHPGFVKGRDGERTYVRCRKCDREVRTTKERHLASGCQPRDPDDKALQDSRDRSEKLSREAGKTTTRKRRERQQRKSAPGRKKRKR